jgi:hypothetical protein
MGLFDPDGPGLAVFEAGRIVAFGGPVAANRLRAALAAMRPLHVEDLEIRAVRHPAPAGGDGWVLSRPHFDLVVTERGTTERGGGAPARST